MTALLHRGRDAKIVLLLVVLALLAAVVVLALTGHAVPSELNAGLIAAVGSLGGVSVPTSAASDLRTAETALTHAVPAGDLTTLRHDVDTALSLASDAMSDTDRQRVWIKIRELESALGITTPVAGDASPLPLPDPEPAS